MAVGTETKYGAGHIEQMRAFMVFMIGVDCALNGKKNSFLIKWLRAGESRSGSNHVKSKLMTRKKSSKGPV